MPFPRIFANWVIAADYFNNKNGLGPTRIYCLFADKREWRFYKVDFEIILYSVFKASNLVFIISQEGTLDFAIEIQKGMFSIYKFLNC